MWGCERAFACSHPHIQVFATAIPKDPLYAPISIIIKNMLSVVIQAGGESRRMGQEKALLPFLGKPLIVRVLERVAPLGAEVLVTTNHPQSYPFLDIPLHADLIPGRGALGGLFTALSVARHPLVAVVACDMPFASPALLAAERDCLVDPPFAVAIPSNGSTLEPFHAVYRRSACLPAIQAALQAGRWRADAWFTEVQLKIFSPEEVRRYDPHQRAFINVNTPAELRQAEELAASIELGSQSGP